MRLVLAVAVAAVALPGTAVSSAAPPVLKGTVGPGFTITLVTAAGKPVKSLKAGRYAVTVTDKSTIHNFRLVGKGLNKEITSVSFTGKKTAVVKLSPGRVLYQCDPHASSMKGSFTVKR